MFIGLVLVIKGSISNGISGIITNIFSILIFLGGFLFFGYEVIFFIKQFFAKPLIIVNRDDSIRLTIATANVDINEAYNTIIEFKNKLNF